jgi:hypothetical protein
MRLQDLATRLAVVEAKLATLTGSPVNTNSATSIEELDARLSVVEVHVDRLIAEKTQSHWIKDWHTTEDWVIPCGLVLIDEAPGEHRKISIEVYSKIADALVVHDTEVGAEYVYGMANILSKCKYRLDYQSALYPRTTLVSNSFNVAEWK